MKMIICVGISASGKSTFARELCDNDESFVEINRDFVRFSIVCPGATWATYKFTRKREQEVTEICNMMVMDAVSKGKNIIISDTNLNPKTLASWKRIAEDIGYDVEVKEFPISFEEAVKRDNLRPNGVGQDVIYKQWLKWLEYKGRKKYVRNPNKPLAVMFDIDGCIAQNTSGRGWYDWAKVGEDTPHQHIVRLVRMYYDAGYHVLILSGRDSVCREITEEWLERYDIPHHYLYMRTKDDNRKDTEIKEEIFWNYIADEFDVELVVDDRACVARNWNEMGLNVLTHGNWANEF